MNDSTKSVDELQREADRSRAEVAGTLQELRTRLSPEVIKEEVKEYAEEFKGQARDYAARAQDEVKNYARQTGEHWVHTVQQTALEHPLAAAMIGAGLTWKTLGIVRAMGVPGLLLGAGIAQIAMNRRGGQGEGAPMTIEARSPQYRAYAQRGDAASYAEWFDAFKAELSGSFRRALQLGSHRASELTGPATASVSEGFNRVTSTVSEAVHHATEESRRAAEAARRAAAEAASSASRRMSETASMTSTLVQDALGEIRQLPQTNPGLVIGAGIAAGAAGAAALAAFARSSSGPALTDMTGRSGWQLGDAPGDWGSDGGAGAYARPATASGFGEAGGQPLQAVVDFSRNNPVAFIAGAIAAAAAAASLLHPAVRETIADAIDAGAGPSVGGDAA